MICILALLVFSILAIFSAKYRSLAKEAFRCVTKRIRLKPCDTGLDKKLKSKLVGKVFKKNKTMGKALNKYFEVFSWVFFIIFLISGGLAVNSLYNYAAYGDCSGENGGGCVLPSSPQCLQNPEECKECVNPSETCVDNCTCEECENTTSFLI